jgi:hypothetical protein
MDNSMTSKIDEDAIAAILYGSIYKISTNKRYYYKGISADYSNLTPEGILAITSFLNAIIPLINLAENEARHKEAMQITFDIMKKRE